MPPDTLEQSALLFEKLVQCDKVTSIKIVILKYCVVILIDRFLIIRWPHAVGL